MPTILAIAALFLLSTDALAIDLSVLPGLSAKNLLIYLIAVMIALRIVVSRQSVMAMGQGGAGLPAGLLPINNRGVDAAAFCFAFLYIATRGAGIWSVDAMMGKGARR